MFRLLKRLCYNFQRLLRSQLLNLGDVEHGIEDVIGFLQQAESDLLEMEDVCCDPNFIDTQLRKVQVRFYDASFWRWGLPEDSAGMSDCNVIHMNWGLPEDSAGMSDYNVIEHREESTSWFDQIIANLLLFSLFSFHRNKRSRMTNDSHWGHVR